MEWRNNAVKSDPTPSLFHRCNIPLFQYSTIPVLQ